MRTVARISAMVLLVVQLLVVMDVVGMASGSVASVTIYNEAGGAVRLHCKSRDNDLGEKTLQPHQHSGWGFTPNFWGTTLFYCNFAWGARSQHLKVWVDEPGCRFCVWQVRSDGFWKTEDGNPNFAFVAPWI